MDQVVQPTGDLHKSCVRVSPVNDRRSKHYLPSAAIPHIPVPTSPHSPTSPPLLGQPLKLCFLLRCQPHVERVGLVRRSSHIGWAKTQTPHVHTQTKRGKAAPRRPHCSCGQTVSSYRGILPCPGLRIHGIQIYGLKTAARHRHDQRHTQIRCGPWRRLSLAPPRSISHSLSFGPPTGIVQAHPVA